MTSSIETYALWLADYYLLATMLLAAALLTLSMTKQPVQKLAIAKSSLVALTLLAGLCALPGWSIVHVVLAESAAPSATAVPVRQLDAIEDRASIKAAVPVGEVTPREPRGHLPSPVIAPADRNWPDFSWPASFVFAHMLGTGVVVMWLVGGLLAARRLRRRAKRAPVELAAIFDEILSRQNASDLRPTLLVSDQIEVAVALGIWRPAVLLPAKWTEARTCDELRTVLAHECAHLRNYDLHWLAASRALTVVLWAQPLYWLLRRRMRLDQETLADAAAADLTSRQRYAEQLVGWARDVSARPTVRLSSAVGLWEGPSQLRRRIAMLIDERFTVLRNCPPLWGRSTALLVAATTLSLSLVTLQPGHSEAPANDSEALTAEDEKQIAIAIRILRETEGIGNQKSMRVHPSGRAHVADDWAEAIRTLAQAGRPAVPALIAALDAEQRDHAISKLAFVLRAIGDPRAVPALIRAIPRTLLPSRSDFGLMIEDPDLLRFAQKHDISAGDGDHFSYGRAFREVVGALHKLTGVNQDDMELNWVHLGEAQSQRRIQRKLFHDLAGRWAAWWSANWERFGVDVEFAAVNLPPLYESDAGEPLGIPSLPIGAGIGLSEFHSGWIVQSAHESKKRCFVDLDTSREAGWPSHIPPINEIGADDERLLRWARHEGFDLVGITDQPPGFDGPVYCLQPLEMQAWQITPEQQRDLPRAMNGEIPYPLGHPVDRLIPSRNDYNGPDKHELGGTAFLFLTREGTAGLLRMMAQVTDTNVQVGIPSSPDDQYSSIGFYRGVKVSFAIIATTKDGTRHTQQGSGLPQLTFDIPSPFVQLPGREDKDTGRVQRTAGNRLPALLSYGDGKADGKKSYGGSGHFIRFELPVGVTKVRGVRIHGSRYGYPQAPDEDFEITFLSDDRDETLHSEAAPYHLFKRGKENWVRVLFEKEVELPEKFWVALNFNAERTKGVYLSYDTSTKGQYSRVGLPGDEDEPKETDFGGDWMVQVMLARRK